MCRNVSVKKSFLYTDLIIRRKEQKNPYFVVCIILCLCVTKISNVLFIFILYFLKLLSWSQAVLLQLVIFKKCEFASRGNYKLEKMLFFGEVLVHFFLGKFKNVEIVGLEYPQQDCNQHSDLTTGVCFIYILRSENYLFLVLSPQKISFFILHGSHMACLPSLMTAILAHGPTCICIVSARTSLTLNSFYLFHCFNSYYY